jgi:hypothetical protein
MSCNPTDMSMKLAKGLQALMLCYSRKVRWKLTRRREFGKPEEYPARKILRDFRHYSDIVQEYACL